MASFPWFFGSARWCPLPCALRQRDIQRSRSRSSRRTRGSHGPAPFSSLSPGRVTSRPGKSDIHCLEPFPFSWSQSQFKWVRQVESQPCSYQIESDSLFPLWGGPLFGGCPWAHLCSTPLTDSLVLLPQGCVACWSGSWQDNCSQCSQLHGAKTQEGGEPAQIPRSRGG